MRHCSSGTICPDYSRYEAYSRLQDNKQGSLLALRNAISDLIDELRMSQKIVELLHEREHQSSFVNFLKSDLSSYWKDFESTLANVQSRCRDIESLDLSDTGIVSASSGKKSITKTFLASNVFSDTLAKSIKHIEASTASVVEETKSLECAYKRLYRVYLLHEIRYRGRSASTSTDFSHKTRIIDAVTASFHRGPFSLSTTSVSADSLSKLNQNHEVLEQAAGIINKDAVTWVEESCQSGSIDKLSSTQIRMMDILWAICIPQMESGLLEFARRIERERIGDMELKNLSDALKNAIGRARNQHFSIAFCGMVKAGKSLFLNALMGRTILPSDELPSTAWPCRLRHICGQSEPELTFNPTPFLVGLARLRDRGFGSKMKDYQPPDDPFADLFNCEEATQISGNDLTGIYYKWKELHKQTRENLMAFENPDFELPSHAVGVDQVTKLLGQLNDIVRLCHRFNLNFPLDSGEWPLLCVEFESLRNRSIEGIFEFVDLPGLGEGFEAFTFEGMIRRVASEVNAVVPVVSFKEIAKQDWRQLARIISSGLATTSLVICTHFDQISGSNVMEQRTTVARVFWGCNDVDRVIPCSSNIGLSAAVLLRLSATKLPDFKTISQSGSVGYPCASTILGSWKPEERYNTFITKLSEWQQAVEWEHKKSGLPVALDRLTSDLVDQTKQKILLSEAKSLHSRIWKINVGQQRVLLEMRRSKDELEAAREAFYRARAEFTDTLDAWQVEEGRRDIVYHQRLNQAIKKLRDTGNRCVEKALEETSKSMSEMILRDEACEPDIDTSLDVLVGSRQDAELFFCKSQEKLATLLKDLSHRFVSIIRELADQASRERIQNLRDAIKALKSGVESELRSEILINLESLAVGVRTLAFQTIRKGLKTEREHYSLHELYKIIEGIIAKPILSLQDEPIDGLTSEITIDDLGLLVKAPVAVIATIPFVASLTAWPFMIKTKRYHCNMSLVMQAYRDKIVEPFLQDLETEGGKNLKAGLAQSSAVAKATVKRALEREDARYERESKEKDKMPSKEEVAELVASYLNFAAAEDALLSLIKLLEKSR